MEEQLTCVSALVAIAMSWIAQWLRGLYRQVACNPEDPRLLGFEAQRVLIDAWRATEPAGEPYDYIAYLEDDILITDADFFLKLRCCNRAFGDHYLLMPNRMETLAHHGQLRRFYIDGDYNPAVTRSIPPEHAPSVVFFPISERWCVFDQPSNLHSGSFSSIVSRRAFMPPVAMQQRWTHQFSRSIGERGHSRNAQDFPTHEACARKRSLPYC